MYKMFNYPLLEKFRNNQVSVHFSGNDDPRLQEFLDRCYEMGIHWCGYEPDTPPNAQITYLSCGSLWSNVLEFMTDDGSYDQRHGLTLVEPEAFELQKEEPKLSQFESLIDRLIKGEISIWCDTKKKAQRVIDGFHAKGMKGSPAVENFGASLAPCSFRLFSGKICFSKMRDSFKSPVDFPSKQPDKLTAVRDGNDIVLTYKQHGKIIKQERVAKHFKDTDNFLVGAEYALKKMVAKETLDYWWANSFAPTRKREQRGK
jgi:hypothetical protein